MIFIALAWSPNMVIDRHYLLDYHEIDQKLFHGLAEYAHSCMNKANLAKILGIKYNPEHVQLRPGDTLLTVNIKGGRLADDAEELPENVMLEFYCYNVYSAETHVIMEKEELKIKMEE